MPSSPTTGRHGHKMTLWDTSAVVKLFVAEGESERLTALAGSQTVPALVSDLVEIELWSALMAKELAQAVPRGFASGALEDYRTGLVDGVMIAVALSARVREAAAETVRRCARGRTGFALRAMDALHLGTALASRCDAIVTTDTRQRQAAAILGLKILPE